MKKILIGLGVVVVLVLVLFLINFENDPIGLEPEEIVYVTDFAKIGTFVVDGPNEEVADLPRLVYEEPGAPALTKKLVFGNLSFCQMENSASLCQVMKETLYEFFDGKRVLVEGMSQGSPGVLVFKMGVIREGESAFVPMTGFVFISWPKAQELIRGCEVNSIFQSHDLDVKLVLKNQKEYRTVEPIIDEVFKVLDEVSGKCGAVVVATE